MLRDHREICERIITHANIIKATELCSRPNARNQAEFLCWCVDLQVGILERVQSLYNANHQLSIVDFQICARRPSM